MAVREFVAANGLVRKPGDRDFRGGAVGACLSCQRQPSPANWGPERLFYHWKGEPSRALVLNSIADNPRWHFEGTFIKVRHEGTRSWCLRVSGAPGDVLEFTAYAENSSASNLNKTTRDLRLSVKKGRFGDATVIRARLAADGVPAVWSEATVVGVRPTELIPEADSARLGSNFYPKRIGPHVQGAIWSPHGALVGPTLRSLGRLNGDPASSFYVYFRARIEPSFS